MPDSVKQIRRFLFSFELRGHGGEADVMILYYMSGAYFANTCITPSNIA